MATARELDIIWNINSNGIFSLVVSVSYMEHERLIACFARCHDFFFLGVLEIAVEVRKFITQGLPGRRPATATSW